jgi:hypothetical protein
MFWNEQQGWKVPACVVEEAPWFDSIESNLKIDSWEKNS